MKGGKRRPTTVDEVFSDYKRRKIALQKALTTDFDKFYKKCYHGKRSLCLFGFSNGKWEVNRPSKLVPPDLPEPMSGINFARGVMEKKIWLSFVAKHYDAWLYAVAFFFAAELKVGESDRERLFQKINKLPTLSEIVRREAKRQSAKRISAQSNIKVKHSKGSGEPRAKASNLAQARNKQDADLKKINNITCGSCRKKYGGFWIQCDIESCDMWYHGRCVNVTPQRAKQMNKYTCPCCKMRRRQLH